MASQTQTLSRPGVLGEAWPPHDTEESVLGTDLHQGTILNLRWGINEAACVGLPTGAPVPWRALSQILLLGCVHPDGSPYRTLPDVFVYPRPIDPTRGSLSLEADGPPVVAMEVLSESTYDVDLDLVRGKGYSYARARVPEYLVLDPIGYVLKERIRAWRLVDGVYQRWLPDADGRWHSAQIPIAVGLDGIWARVYTRDGRPMLREGEVEQAWARIEEERARERARFAEELARKDAELARLRQRPAERQGHD